jgi:signal peptidase I
MNTRSVPDSVPRVSTERLFIPIYDPRKRVASFHKLFSQFLLIGLLAFACYVLISQFLLQSVQVVGSSMVPTLHDADHYFLNRWIYHMHDPKRSDIVVIKDPTDGVYAVKRIIAMPGETVHIKNGGVYVNGKRLDEPYLGFGGSTFTNSKGREQLVLCGKDQYFVLGDNRSNSFDSRSYGPVRRKSILGTVIR